MPDKMLVTKSGFLFLKEERDSIDGALRKKDLKRLKHDYGSVEKAKSRLKEIKVALDAAKVVDLSETDIGNVRFGCFVVLGDLDTGEEVRVRIVGDIEACEKEGRISVESELGKVLIGKSIGSCVEIKKGKKVKEYEIIDISVV